MSALAIAALLMLVIAHPIWAQNSSDSPVADGGDVAALIDELVEQAADDPSEAIIVLPVQPALVDQRGAVAVATATAIPSPQFSEADIAARVALSIVQVRTPDGLGSGVRIAQGLLTNEHVVSGADQIEVITGDGRRENATPSRMDQTYDLALLQTTLNVPPLELQPARQHRQGDPVLVMGYPRADVLGGQPTLSRGIISAMREDENGVLLVQTDAAINAGSSGGALMDLDGRLIGIASFRVRGSQGLNFAVAAESVQAFLDGTPPPRTATPRPTATVTPTPSGPNPSDRTYLNAVQPLLDKLSASMDRLGGLRNQSSLTAVAMIRAEAATWQETYRLAQQLSPSPRFRDYHTKLMQALATLNDIAGAMILGIDTRNSRGFDAALARWSDFERQWKDADNAYLAAIR